jgi:hypothetical protein
VLNGRCGGGEDAESHSGEGKEGGLHLDG